jgi:hypothetical protein
MVKWQKPCLEIYAKYSRKDRAVRGSVPAFLFRNRGLAFASKILLAVSSGRTSKLCSSHSCLEWHFVQQEVSGVSGVMSSQSSRGEATLSTQLIRHAEEEACARVIAIDPVEGGTIDELGT